MNTLSPELAADADAYIDQQHADHQQLGDLLFATFKYDHKSGRVKTQIRNLQQIALSARQFADIEDFVKTQMGKETSNSKQWRQVGDDVLKQLAKLRAWAERVEAPPEVQLALRLRLARSWVRGVVAAYLYRVALDQMEGGHA